MKYIIESCAEYYNTKYSVELCANDTRTCNHGVTSKIRDLRGERDTRFDECVSTRTLDEASRDFPEARKKKKRKRRKFPKPIIRAEEDLTEAKTKIDRRNKRVLGERWLEGG